MIGRQRVMTFMIQMQLMKSTWFAYIPFGMLSIDKGENSTNVPVFVIISLHQSRCVLVNSCAQAKIKISFGSPYLTDQALNLSYNFKTSFLS